MASARQVVEQAWQAYIDHDLDAVMAHYAEDAVLTLPASPPAEGRDAIRQTWAGVLGAFPDDSPTIDRVLAEGDTVVVQFHSAGTNSGPLALPTGETLPATGRRVEIAGVSLTDVRDGLIVREAFFWDSASFLTQLGLIPQPNPAGATG